MIERVNGKKEGTNEQTTKQINESVSERGRGSDRVSDCTNKRIKGPKNGRTSE